MEKRKKVSTFNEMIFTVEIQNKTFWQLHSTYAWILNKTWAVKATRFFKTFGRRFTLKDKSTISFQKPVRFSFNCSFSFKLFSRPQTLSFSSSFWEHYLSTKKYLIMIRRNFPKKSDYFKVPGLINIFAEGQFQLLHMGSLIIALSQVT